jgi:hypothetical protein
MFQYDASVFAKSDPVIDSDPLAEPEGPAPRE